jgi:hypothetical protein
MMDTRMPFEKTVPWTTPQALDAVRPRVRELLTAIPTYKALSATEQRELAANMVKVLAYISDPNGIMTETGGVEPSPARALADDPVEATKSMLSAPPKQAGQDFKAGAVREGVEQIRRWINQECFSSHSREFD